MNRFMQNSAWWLLPRFCFDENPSSGGAAVSPAGGAAAPPAAAPSPGGAAPPASTPAQSAPPETSPPTSPEGGGDPFQGMDDDLDSIDLGLGEPPTPGEGGEQPTPPVAPPVVPPQAVTPAGAPPVAAPQGAQPPQANVDTSPRSQVDVAIEGFRTNHKELSEWASQNLFALTKEDSEALDTDAVTMIPKLMGRVYTSAIQATANLIKNFVPDMVNSGVTSQQQRAARSAEALSQFYQANPHLNAEQHGAAVDKWARAFRAANPQASRQDAIAFVGRAVSAEHGLAPGTGNGAQRRAAPFTPARPGGRAPQTPQAGDPYAGMEDEYD